MGLCTRKDRDNSTVDMTKQHDTGQAADECASHQAQSGSYSKTRSAVVLSDFSGSVPLNQILIAFGLCMQDVKNATSNDTFILEEKIAIGVSLIVSIEQPACSPFDSTFAALQARSTGDGINVQDEHDIAEILSMVESVAEILSLTTTQAIQGFETLTGLQRAKVILPQPVMVHEERSHVSDSSLTSTRASLFASIGCRWDDFVAPEDGEEHVVDCSKECDAALHDKDSSCDNNVHQPPRERDA